MSRGSVCPSMRASRASAAEGAQVVPFAIEEPVAECARHPGAAVVRRAATDADYDVVRAAHRGSEDELPGAARARDPRVAFSHVEQR